MIDPCFNRFDGKHWLARTLPGESPRIPAPAGEEYEFFANVVRVGLGREGIVAIINARGGNHQIGGDYRYEWLVEKAGQVEKERRVRLENLGRFFYDSEREIWVVKGQEIDTPDATLLVYGTPYGENLDEGNFEQVLEEARKKGAIPGISRIKSPTKVLEHLPELAFIVTYKGTRIGMRNPNRKEERLWYEELSKRSEVGAIAVSGGYDLTYRNQYPIIGRCNSSLEFDTENKGNFLTNLESALRKATPNWQEQNPIYSGVLRHAARMTLDRLRGKHNPRK